MAYSALTNSSGVVEFRRIPNGFTIADMNDGFDQGLQVEDEDLPDTEQQDCLEIIDGALVVGDGIVTKLKNALKEEIDGDVQSSYYNNITVDNVTYQVTEKAVNRWSIAKTPLAWYDVNNAEVELDANKVQAITDAISERDTASVVDGRRKKDLVEAMTTVEELEAVDIDSL